MVNDTNISLMMSLIASQVCCVPISADDVGALSEHDLKNIYALSKKHDMAHLVGSALDSLGMLEGSETAEQFRKHIMLARYRHAKIDHEFGELCGALERAEVPFIPLKGAVLRTYYPEPWMRTSCDIDILVHESDLERAVEYLTEKLQYKYSGKDSHDVSLYSPGGVHIELHYILIEEKRYPRRVEVLGQVWEYAGSVKGSEYHYRMSDDMFVFYHIAHMAKHLEGGGCGIRPLLDLWILEHNIEHSDEARDQLLRRGDILTFANAARRLSAMWFDGGESDALLCRLQNYLLDGGTYGNRENHVAVGQVKKGGKFSYAMSRVFLPYDQLKFNYPSLQGRRWLTPLYQVRRWFKLVFGGGAKRSLYELKLNSNMSDEQRRNVGEMLSELGL